MVKKLYEEENEIKKIRRLNYQNYKIESCSKLFLKFQ